jgi:hypothetical protein
MNEDALNKIFRALGNIEGKLDTVIETVDSHAEQISGLEKVKTQALTLVGFVTFAMTFGWDWVKHKLGLT